MRWKLVIIISCVLVGSSAIAIVAQGTSDPAPAGVTQADEQASEPRPLGALTRILRNPDQTDQVDGAVAELDAMVAAGNANAALLLGTEYAKDRGSLSLDYDKAAAYLEQAATLGIPQAWLTLSQLHRREAGGLPRAKTLDYLKAAADAGLDEALMPLADALRKGTYAEPDMALAAQYYDAALAAGNADALKQLIAIYKSGTGSPDDGASYARYLGIAADGGDASAHRALADLYSKGTAVPQDLALAERHMRAAMDAGDDSATMPLATGLLRGLYGPGREAEGVALLQSIFDAGSAAAAAPLADAYLRGRGVTADPTKAVAILRTGSDDGDMTARAALFNLYVRGAGKALPPDIAAAAALYDTMSESDRTAPVKANAAILAAHGRHLDDFAHMWAQFRGLDPSLQARTGQQLLRVNANAYVYMLQGLLTERGHYSGSMSGQLTSTTIAAVNQFCAEQNIAYECRFGPLARSTWDVLSGPLVQ